MRTRALDSLAGSLCHYLCSRNNDIGGYWGVGVLCALAKHQEREAFEFDVVAGRPITIAGHEISESRCVTDKLAKFNLDALRGAISFAPTGSLLFGAEKYICTVSLAVLRTGRLGFGTASTACWPHDPLRKSRRASGMPG